MSYVESATAGNFLDMLRFAVLNGALWAVGTSWSTAIRAVTLQIVPDDSRDVVFGELAAASVTTILSVVVSYTVMRRGCCTACKSTDAHPPSPPPPPRTRPSRV